MAKRLAIVSSGVASPLSSALEFAKRAQSLGYEVGVFAHHAARELILHCDLQHIEIPEPRVDAFAPLLTREEMKGLTAQQRKDAAVDALEAKAFADALAGFRPDALFVDCELHAQILVGLSQDIPVVQFSNMFLSPPGLRAPPLNKRAQPGTGLLGSRIGVSLIWASFLLWKLKKRLRNRIRYGGAEYGTALIELAGRLGVPLAQKRRLICWQMPWTYRIPTALLLPKALDLPTRLYPSFTYLGAMILQDRPEKPHDPESAARFCAPTDGKKRIFVGFGTMMHPKSRLLSNLWAVARKHPEWQFLFAAGRTWDERSLLDLPPNVEMVAWVPQQSLLHYADLAIMHGGTGGFVEAVGAATPVLLYPHVNDQQGSATRAVFHGIGRAGQQTDSPDQIEADIQALLSDARYKENCGALQAAYRKEHDEASLAEYLRSITVS
ncbi:glycosyltransferase [Ruegeria sp. R14_0]|uniref:nucleotide disphospho-sugar-binding domain-containing protein n=1 Tax=Ruegeria sp. R14_0 TaxID=2821100 RepID=UPI001ADD02D9|nr:glycosyltransferase [Ruegeria sp. R14_0]MBO9446347.1 glycosyltransferase family 1 protein [Ruegeria sp. R14_0]